MPSRRFPNYSTLRAKDVQNNNTFEARNGGARFADMLSRANGTSQGRKVLAAGARQIRLDSTSKSQNNYEFGSQEDAQAQHRSRYRALRKAFGMSAG